MEPSQQNASDSENEESGHVTNRTDQHEIEPSNEVNEHHTEEYAQKPPSNSMAHEQEFSFKRMKS